MRTLKDEEVCNSKVLYDTEFEATLSCARFIDEMKPYRCPGTGHYHITHAVKEQRLGYGMKKALCPKCKLIRNRLGMTKHIRRCNGSRDDRTNE